MPIFGLVADTRSPKIAPYKCPWPRVRCQKRSILASLKIAPSIIFSRVIQPNDRSRTTTGVSDFNRPSPDAQSHTVYEVE